MDPIIGGSLIMGGAGLLGGYLNNQQNQNSAKWAADFSAAEAQKNRSFQARMAGSAYQRSMKDMRKAGLNPMLAFSQGGASTPGGATASASAPHMEDILGKGIASAVEGRRLRADMEEKEQGTKLLKEQTDVAETSKWKMMFEKAKLQEDTKLTEAHRKQAEEETKIFLDNLPTMKKAAQLDAESALKRSKIDNKLVPVDAGLQRIGQAVGVGASAVGIGRMIKGFQPREETTEVYDSRGEHRGTRTTIRR